MLKWFMVSLPAHSMTHEVPTACCVRNRKCSGFFLNTCTYMHLTSLQNLVCLWVRGVSVCGCVSVGWWKNSNQIVI